MPTTANEIRISRRTFLRSFSLIAAGGLLAACAVGEEGALPANRLEPSFTQVDLPLTRAGAEAAAQQDAPELPQFLALSALLTGVDNLDPGLGAIYLQSLNASSEFAVSVAELLNQAQAGLPTPPHHLGTA